MRAPIPILLVAGLGACKRPPDAPTELEDLCGYLFGHVADEDPDELEAGLVNLDAWLDGNLDETLDGYTINRLDEAVVDALDDRDRSVEDLVGAAVASESAYGTGAVVEVLILADQDEVSGNQYKVYDRSFDGDPECFASRDCDWLEAEIYTLSSWAGLVEIGSTSISQYRWLEIDDLGWVMAQRSWMVEPAEISYTTIDFELSVDANYFLQVLLPAPGGSLRMQATWIDADYGVLPVSEDYAMSRMITEMQDMSDQIESYLDEH